MNHWRYWLAPLVLCLTAGNASAQQAPGSKSYVTVVPVYVDPDENRGSDEGFGVHLSYGHLLTGNWYVEGLISAANLETGSDGGTDFYQSSIGLDLAYRFGRAEGMRPFLLAGVGAMYNDVFPDSQDETSFYANAGLGLVSGEIGDSGMRLRAEVRYFHDDYATGLDDWRAGVGVEVPLGRSRTVTRTVEVPVVREVVREVPVEPLDSDGDGVADKLDRCPDTLREAVVDGRGCVKASQTIELKGVHFEWDSARLTANSRLILQGVAVSLKSQPDLRFEIAGHTDATGSDAYNRKLSQARAKSVYTYLLSQGIAAARMQYTGYGESQPAADNSSPLGRELNRRVEFRIQGDPATGQQEG